jgi:indole-3-glycerol phosphate synthase/phosphoribosylanthranilate isomerase
MGADLVLLIASVLIDEKKGIKKLKSMKNKAESMGLLPLIEVHNFEEIKEVLKIKPKLLGINSRDLKSFKINRAYPFALRSIIDKDINVIYESGIRNYSDAFFAGSSGFKGVLVGTSIVKSGDVKSKITDIKNGFINGIKNHNDFYNKIFKTIYLAKKIVVKICGITNLNDAKIAVKNGADIIGFILAKSPRQIALDDAMAISSKIGKKVLKVLVVVDEFIESAVDAVKKGHFDAVQFHGDIDNEKAAGFNVNWYKAVRVSSKEDFNAGYSSPVILYDAFSKEAYGGTGKLIDDELLNYAVSNNIDLYLAGGINPDNVAEIIKKYKPLMIDACSGLESSPGKKDAQKIKKFFKEIKKSYE